ncbi:MAG: hypothetical protein QOF20_3082, partial [Acidimicrobiaceae bacterium]|nr:hypothetical protein [Acidimicrobiaceae bacterium]
GGLRNSTYVRHGTESRKSRDVLERSRSNSEAEPGTSRESRGAKTRERIVVAAAEAFADVGYNGINLNDVVVGLDLTKGALYYFFPTKEALVVEIVRRHFELFAAVGEAALSQSDNRLDAFVELTYQVGRLFQHNPITRAGARLTNERNVINADLPRPFVGWIDRITQLLRQAKRRGELRADVRPKEIAELVVSFFFGAQTISNEFHQRKDLLVRLDRFWALVLPSLRPEAP